MDNKIKNALIQCVTHYSIDNAPAAEQLSGALVTVFSSTDSFMDKVSQLDGLIDDHADYEALREVLFDLLMLNFFSSDVSRLESDYMESEEWAEIEEQTLDRGTELLNLLLYLAECADEEIDPDLEDYLQEFLLVDEDEFQDEHHIYEPIISRQILVESSFGEIANAARSIPKDQELADLFYPIMAYFYEPVPDAEDLREFEQFAPNPAFDRAVYQALVHYK